MNTHEPKDFLLGLVLVFALCPWATAQINLNPPNQLLPPPATAPNQGQIPLRAQTPAQPSQAPPPNFRTAQQTPQAGSAGVPTSPVVAVPQAGGVQPALVPAQPVVQPLINPTSAPVSDAITITPEAVTTVLQQLQAATDLEASLKQTLVNTYEAILAEAKSRLESEKRTKDIAIAYEAAPAATAEAKKRRESPTVRRLFSDGSLEITPIDTLKAFQLEIQGLAQAATDARVRVETEIVSRETNRKEIPRLIAEDKATVVKLNEQLALPPAEGIDPRVREANILLLRAKLLAVNERIRRLEQEQRTVDEKFQLTKLKEVKDELGKRQENQIAERRRRIEELVAQASPEVKARAASLLKRTDDWLLLAKQNTSLRMESDSAKTELNLWTERYKIMYERISPESSSANDLKESNQNRHVSNFNSWVGLMLRKQRMELPDISDLRKKLHEYQTKLVSTETLILELDDWKAASALSDEVIGSSIALPADAFDRFASSTPIDQKRILHAMEHELVGEFRKDANTYLDNLFALAGTNQKMINKVRTYRAFIDENILWIRSCEPINKGDFRNLWPALQWLFSLANWKSVPFAIYRDFLTHPWLYVLGIAAYSVILLNVKRLKQQVAFQGRIAAKSSCTSFLPTAKVLLYCVLLSMPLALLHLVFGWRLSSNAEGDSFVQAIAMGLLVSARYFFPLEMIRQFCRTSGLAENHFTWSDSTSLTLRQSLRWFIDLAVPAVAIVTIVGTFGESKWENSLGRLVYCVLMGLCFLYLTMLLHPKRGVFSDFLSRNAGGWIDRLRFVWYGTIVLGPIALMGMSLMGYHYTSIRLAMLFHTTLITLVSLLLLSNLIRRWLLLRRRQIVVSQARQRLEEARRRDPGASSSTSTVQAPAASMMDSAADLAQINAQTIRLIRSTLIFAAIGAVAFIWSGVLPAVGVLESIKLWTVVGATPDEAIPITLANMLIAIPTIIMTVVAARNLPGLLEIALLQHLPLENAVRYAIASLSRYAILILGIAMIFNSLGVRWASVQWLVAALGVGLGFGLQEIFANFISGLILLFEQPIRVGDVITIGDTTGHVSRIRMRATTVTNFDQQELVIPNKDLITGRLLNWTLTDSTNRIIIQVGVSYSTNPTRACQLLKEICLSHPNVLREPEPTAFFEQFGDSTLDLKARIFLANLDQRLPTKHDLQTEIKRRFEQEGIEISFPQRDLHIRSMPGTLLPAIVPTAPQNFEATKATKGRDL
jgi:potassium-dependent mechanosensitive channel